MKVAYFCATPLHVINAVNMLLTCDSASQADIYVYNHFSDSQRLTEALGNTGIFEKCVYLDENVNSIRAKIRRLFHCFYPCAQIRDIKKNGFKYDKAVFFSLDQINMSYLIKKGRDCEFYYGEDGLGSYINPDIYVPKGERALILKLTGRMKYLERVKGLYVHNPELLIANRSYKAKKIEKTDFSGGEMKRILEILWPIEQGKINPERNVIYFEEPVREIFKTDAAEAEKALTEFVKESFGQEKFYIKKHPRMIKTSREQGFALDLDAPFERIMGHWELDKTVLISVVCTAALQPTLLCGKNPVMIFLYKMFLNQDDVLYAVWEKFFEKLQELYGEQMRIYLPSSFEELKEAVNSAAQIE